MKKIPAVGKAPFNEERMSDIMREPVLVILAAGMGSRYGGGGLKQVDPVGAFHERIIDYSLYDARRAGFRKAVFVVKEEQLPVFQEEIFSRAGKYIDIDYVFQKQDDVPAGFSVPEGRVKPWGTGHAALTAARILGNAPYAVINADDFYGREGFQKIYDFLKNAEDGEVMNFAMVGYYLRNTVTENGSVSRGVCETENGKLKEVVERTRIEKRGNIIACPDETGEGWIALPENAIVSMNLWGFTPGFTAALEQDYARMFREDVPKDPLKAELFLPFVVNGLLAQGKAEVTVLSSADKWYGVTYHEDKEQVVKGIRSLTERGLYPSPLWE